MWVEKNGPTYRIRDLVAGRKVTVKAGLPNKTTANRVKTQLEADAIRGDALVPRGGQMLLADWVDAWWPAYAPSLKPSALTSADGIVRRYIRPLLGHLALDEVDSLTLQRWVAELLAGFPGQKPLAPKTVHNAHGQLHKILKEAVHARLIRQNPAEHTGLPKIAPREMRFLTEPEAARLLQAMPDHWRPLIALLIGTGLRWGEATGLKAKNVDLFSRRVTVVEQLQELADTAELVWEQPKSRMSRRTVPLPAYAVDALVPLVAGRGRDHVIFTAVQGGYVRYRVFWRTWQRTVKAAGLDGLRIHDLRHTHAAWLISAGVPLTAVQRRLGHASISVTSDRYGHLMPAVDDKILTALDAALPHIDTAASPVVDDIGGRTEAALGGRTTAHDHRGTEAST